MKIFADQHHMGLYHSLKMLLEDRLGHSLYHPIGTEWLSERHWRMAEIYNNHPATVAQYLGIRPDYELVEPGIYKVYDPQHECYNHGMTLDKFREVRPDVVIASIPEHIDSFKKLADEVGAKMIYQIGNAWPVEAGLAPNVMSSAKIANVPPDVHFIEYHQEFPLDIFCYHPPELTRNIFSFINCFGSTNLYRADWPLFEEVELLLSTWYFRAFGASCRDGEASGVKEVSDRMRKSRFIWHTKAGGDGYGHILYNTAAVGRPMLIKCEYYSGKMGEELLIDGQTCIAIDGLSPQEIVNKIEYYNEPERYAKMSEDIYNNFKDKVNFESETQKLKEFIDNLI